MPIRMAIRFSAILFAILVTVHSQPTSLYAAGGTVESKLDASNARFAGDDNSSYRVKTGLGNYAIESLLFANPRDLQVKPSQNRLPFLRMEPPRFLDDHLILPLAGRERTKKGQRAILLDAAEYIVKNKGDDDTSNSGGGPKIGVLRTLG